MLPPIATYPCVRPDGLTLAIVPRQGYPHGPLGRCGHTIFDRHSLIIRNGIGVPVEVVDTAALEERRRNEYGIRPHGWFGGWFGFSPHRCDACRRKKELEDTIVCPCCRRTILRGDSVSRIASALVDQVTKQHDLRPYFVTTEDEEYTVVCAECGEKEFGDQEEPNGFWTGDAVAVYAPNAAAA